MIITSKTEKTKCFHCGNSCKEDSIKIIDKEQELYFCCHGCLNAYRFIKDLQLDTYYLNREDYGEKPKEKIELSLFEYYDKKIPVQEENGKPYKEKVFYIHGLHCASCVWLNEKVVSNLDGIINVQVNFSNNRIYLKWDPDKISLAKIVENIYKIGYQISIIEVNQEKDIKFFSDTLLKKMAVSGFFTGNNMMISASLYAGYFDYMDPQTKQFFHYISFLMATPVFFYSASEFFKNAFYSLKSKILSMDILTVVGISLAYFYSIWITFTHQYQKEVFFDAICFVVFAVLTGRFIENRLKLKTHYFTTNLGSLIPVFTRKLKNGHWILNKEEINDSDFEYVYTDQIKENEFILIYPEETIPLDSILISEMAEVDESSISGEYTPIIKQKGDIVVSGSKNISNFYIVLKVLKNNKESTLSQILKMSENCIKERSPAETLAFKVANYFIFFVLLLGGITFIYWYYIKNQLEYAIVNTLSVLIVACPCALSLSIPTAMIVGIQKLFSYGFLLKNSKVIELLSKSKTIAFDKTGTLTEGKMEINEIFSYISQEDLKLLIRYINLSQRDLLLQHPITNAFFKLEKEIENKTIILQKEDFDFNIKNIMNNIIEDNVIKNYIPGRGIIIKINNKELEEIYLGSKKMIEEFIDSVFIPDHIHVYLAVKLKNKVFILAIFSLKDKIKEEAYSLLEKLNKNYNTILLTGDTKENAELIKRELNIKNIYYGLKPEEKASIIKDLQKNDYVVMIGDGINDTIALKQSDVAISFADASKLAMYSSDILLLNTNLNHIEYLIGFSNKIIKRIKQNLMISFVYNILLLPFALVGFINPFIGSIFMSLSSITVVLNSLMLLKYNKN